jgi:uncharacterized protein YidB (DUF937 family)
MGLLDEVIGAALGGTAAPPPSQSPQTQPAGDQFAQIAAALSALLAPQAAPVAGRPGMGTQQGAQPQASPAGLDVLIDQFRQNGLGDVISSWIGTGRNQPISPSQLGQAIGPNTVNNLSRQTGAPASDLLSQLARYLPEVIDKLTPNGQLPSQRDFRPPYRGD